MPYRLSVWLHIVGACVWVGGILFFAFVLAPVFRRARGPGSAEFLRAVGTRFRIVGWTSVGFLLLTGVVNLFCRYSVSDVVEAAFWISPFGQALLVKLVLVVTMIVVSVVHDVLGARATALLIRDPRSSEAKRLRALSSLLGRLDAVLALGILFAAVVLVRGW